MLFDAQGVNGSIPTTDVLGNSITVTNGTIQNNKLALTNGYLEYNTTHQMSPADSWTLDIIFEGNIVPAFQMKKNVDQFGSVINSFGGKIGPVGAPVSPSAYAPYITNNINYLRISYNALGTANTWYGIRMWTNGNNFNSFQYTYSSGYDLIPYVGKFFVPNGNAINVPYFNNKILGFRIIKNPTDLPTNSIYTNVNVTVPSLPLKAI